MTIGQALKRLRKRNKLKQQWVASCTGMHQQRLSCIENDKIPNLTVGTINRLATFYKRPAVDKVIARHLDNKPEE